MRSHSHRAFTLIELIACIVIVAVLFAIMIPVGSKVLRKAKKTGSMQNLRTFVQADMLYLADKQEFPPIDTVVPSTMTRNRLAIVAEYLDLDIPPGAVSTWPRRKQQPNWINDPIARESGFAEGMTVGGGVYNGYIYVGRIDESMIVQSGMATLTNPERAADRKNMRRGVLWATILAEFQTSDPRRYECFHFNTFFSYPDFRFKESEIDGQYRGWSDGSVEWVPGNAIDFGGEDIQVRHFLGNFYY